jgi:molybdenum cofactor guanylyltransferase
LEGEKIEIKMKPHGLVLMGGKSQRMGEDKSKLVYHNTSTQMDFVYQLLHKHCQKTFVSIGFHQTQKYEYETIRDKNENVGPLSGIISAFSLNQNVAWLVCPIDMPFVGDEVISYLIENRNVEKDCTCFYNEQTHSPDPLLGIYEPSIFIKLLNAQKKGILSPKKCVSLSDHNLILPQLEKWLFNANTPENKIEAKGIISL